jgi:hypothetical protein
LALSCILGASTAVAQQSAKNDITATEPAPRAGQRPQTVVTRLAAFSIPYNSAQAKAEGAVAVQLLVSIDQGAKWHLYATQRADVDQFMFRAARDGEYWFASRLVRDGNRVSADPATPELRVIVDTSQPDVSLKASVSTSGKVTAKWQVADANPQPRSVVLEYRGVNQRTWRAVDISAVVDSDGSGEMEFMPEATSPRVDVRLRAADKAGNVASSERQLLVSLFAASPRRDAASADSSPPPQDPFTSHRRRHPAATTWPENEQGDLAQQASPLTDDNWRSNNIGSSSPRTNEQEATAQAPASPGDALPERKLPLANRGSSASPSSAPQGGSFAPASIPRQSSASLKTKPGQQATATAGDASPTVSTEDEPPTPINDLAEVQPRHSPIAPPVANRVEADQPESFTPTDQSSPLPPGEQALIVNRNRFPLAYDVESVGPSGVKSVVLWGTKDGGRTWREWGQDEDLQSPIDVQVAGDGVYGFRVVAENRDGLKGEAPRPGSPADIWVKIDATPPEARITAAPYGVGENEGLLDIQWEVADANLGDRPITLLFATDPQGRWTTIATGLPNTGHYNWRVDANVPRQVYVRLEVRDKAGNLGVHQLTEPINVAGLRPKARIRGVLPIQQTPRGAQLLRQYR